MNALRILVVQQSPDIGGAEVFMNNLLKEFVGKGHNVSVLTTKGKFLSMLRKESVRVQAIPYTLDIIGNIKGLIKSVTFFPVCFIFYFLFLLKNKDNIDIILMSGFSEKMLVTILAKFFRIKVIWIEYGPLDVVFKKNFYIPKILYYLLSGVPEKIIVPSLNTKKHLISTLNKLQNKICLIPCGIPISKAFQHVNYPHFDKKLVIGCISRLTREKGQEHLLNAVPKIINEYPDARFLFVGDGPDKDYFMNIVTTLDLRDYVEFTGFVKEVSEYYKYMDIFVFPSTWNMEGFGLVSVEAMSREIPVVGSNNPPIPEIIGEKAGVIVDVFNTENFSKELVKLCKNKTKRAQMGREGRMRTLERFDIKKVCHSYEEVFYASL